MTRTTDNNDNVSFVQDQHRLAFFFHSSLK